MPGEIDPAELPTENLLWLPETGKWYTVCPLDFIQTARRYRRMLGGGLRQAGLMAAGGLYALDHHMADLRLDIQLPTAAPATAGLRVAGSITGNQLALCRADTLLPLVSLERCEAPVDLSIDGSTVTLRDFRLISPLFRVDVSGRIGMPQGTWWEWAELLIGDDFALAADVDLAAAARSVTGGLQVRPDVRVTGGQLQLAAAARSEGTQRVLEARLASRDLEVVQGERQLRWAEPFVGWLRSRRGAGRGERMRVERPPLAALRKA
jgi:hypothetical protein